MAWISRLILAAGVLLEDYAFLVTCDTFLTSSLGYLESYCPDGTFLLKNVSKFDWTLFLLLHVFLFFTLLFLIVTTMCFESSMLLIWSNDWRLVMIHPKQLSWCSKQNIGLTTRLNAIIKLLNTEHNVLQWTIDGIMTSVYVCFFFAGNSRCIVIFIFIDSS